MVGQFYKALKIFGNLQHDMISSEHTVDVFLEILANQEEGNVEFYKST